jgi:hypothetical protein
MVLKIPPPPFMTGPEWAGFNRWLIELTSILADTGGIDPASVEGFEQALIQLAENTADIASLQASQGTQAVQIGSLQAQVAGLVDSVATINGQITTLSARAQVFTGALGGGAPGAGLGADNDWFYNRTGAAGNRLFIKVGGAWAAQAI